MEIKIEELWQIWILQPQSQEISAEWGQEGET